MAVSPSYWTFPTAFFHLLVVELGPPFGLLALSQMTNLDTMLATQVYAAARPNCGSGTLTNQFDNELYPDMSIAKLMKCILTQPAGIALDYAWNGCPITMGDMPVSGMEDAGAALESLSAAGDDRLDNAVGLSDTTKGLFGLAVLLIMVPPILAVGSYFVSCRELSFGSGRYIQWSWDFKRSLKWKVCVGFLGVYQFGLFLFIAYIALLGPQANNLGAPWLIKSVGLQFLAIAFAIKKVLTGVLPHHNLSGQEIFDDLVFSRDLVALVSENNENFSSRLVDALFRYHHGSDDALNKMVGDKEARESLLLWVEAAEELSTDGEDSMDDQEAMLKQ